MKFTKIVATVAGNACTRQFIRELEARGMNVVRLNTAHMSPEELEKAVGIVRSVSPISPSWSTPRDPTSEPADSPNR